MICFDFGLRRIGLASGDTLTRTATPLVTVAHHHSGPDWPAIDRQVRLLGPDLVVVGVPYNEDGSPGTLAPRADAFAQALKERYGLEVARIDERYSSTAAHSLLREQRASGQRRRQLGKGDIDSAAAAVMLASWLEQHS
ncbi:MAG: Holliday junction resolvase RuvX [Pseudomonadota bacterium]|nr:Holliday junction resolvase RuvX [Pseudomonadota bacterium]